MDPARNALSKSQAYPHATTRTRFSLRGRPYRADDDARAAFAKLLAHADIRIDGDRPWDITLHHPQSASRIMASGSLGLGESYMDGWWECAQIDEFIRHILQARLHERVGTTALLVQSVRARLFNLQNLRRAWQVAKVHYDLGNDVFEAMLGQHMAYTCGYWAGVNDGADLDAAQAAKLDLVCRKLALEPGMRLLDIGCGWGSLMKHAAEHYGASCVGVTISREQADYGRQRCDGLPVEFRLMDYREVDGQFDRIASLGMFEHVGHKNHRDFFEVARRCLTHDGLLLLHTIGKNLRRTPTDPWIDRYIFPNGDLPSLGQIADASEDFFIIEDVHNFGADYDRTLVAWHTRFEAAWPRFCGRYGEHFRRMWRYYLLACAGTFRARSTQLWQIVLSPNGVAGGYRRIAR
jgi:cyclopropane-fatty-acyl-phospholipid synthase